MPNTKELPELLTCGCCFADVQTIAATVYHVGYTAFSCGVGNTEVKYLEFKKEGIGTVNACGGWNTNKKNLTQTWTVDRFTGARTPNGGLTWSTCYEGDEGNVSYLCGTLDSCTATEKNYKCPKTTPEEQAAFCTEEDFEKTAKESLTNGYTLDDVSDDVDSSINAFNFSNPKGTFGTVKFGTNGNKVLEWSASGGTPESRFTILNSQGVRDGVYKQKSKVKILKDGVLTKITELEESGEIIEETIQVTKDQIIILDPPDEPGKIYFIPYCPTKYLSTNIKTSCSGSLTTKTVPTANCSLDYWTGPDCKKYNTRTEVGTTEAKGSDNQNCSGGGDIDTSEWTYNSKFTYSKEEIIDPSFPNCYKKTETSTGNCETGYTWDNSYKTANLKGEAGNCVGSGEGKCTTTVTDGVYTANSTSSSKHGPNISDGGFCLLVVDSECGEEECSFSDTKICCSIVGFNGGSCDSTVSEPFFTGPTSPAPFCSATGSTTSTTKITIGDKSYTKSFNQNSSGGDSGCGCSRPLSYNETSEFSITFSNKSNSNNSWKTVTSSDCNSCGSWYVTHNSDVKRTATVSIEASFQAPDVGKNSKGEPNPPKNYITYVQRVRREDDTSKQDCLGVTYVSDIITHNSTSSGGEVKVPVPSVTLKSEKDISDCLVHVSAITFEVEQ
jgi:hypothetical protein